MVKEYAETPVSLWLNAPVNTTSNNYNLLSDEGCGGFDEDYQLMDGQQVSAKQFITDLQIFDTVPAEFNEYESYLYMKSQIGSWFVCSWIRALEITMQGRHSQEGNRE